MATQLFTGRSQAADTRQAITEAMDQALAHAEHPVFALVLSTPHYDPAALTQSVASRWGRLPWAGCTASGLIHQHELLRQGVVIGVISSRNIKVQVGVAGPLSRGSAEAGALAARNALSGWAETGRGAHRALLVFPDSRSGRAAEALQGVARETGSNFAWAGAGTADFPGAVQYASGRTLSDHVVVVAIEAPSPFGSASAGGWLASGPALVVTATAGALVTELNHEPAFEVFRRHAADLPRTALGLPHASGRMLIQVPLANATDGSIRFRSEIPRGTVARLMTPDRDALLASAFDAATRSRKSAGPAPGGAFIFQGLPVPDGDSGEIEEKLAFIRSGLGRDVAMIGCLGAGEVTAPERGLPDIQDQNVVVMTLPGEEISP